MASDNTHRNTRGAHTSYLLSSPSTTQPGSNIRPSLPAPIPPHGVRMTPNAPPKHAHMTLKSRYQRIFTNWWLWEILAVLLSLATFSALVIVLILYDGRAVSALPKRISLNAIVSILGTISRTTLMFSISATLSQFKWLLLSGRARQLKDLQLYDGASRGPLGSAALLRAEKGRSWASLGALITILVLVFDPFFQQLIRISSRVVYSDSPSAILKQALDVSGLGPMTLEKFNDSLVEDINEAVYSPVLLPHTQPRCPTHNCLWPQSTSLGFCSSCQNVTQEMQRDSTSVWSSPFYASGHQGEAGWGQQNVTFTYSVPRSLLNGYGIEADSSNPNSANLTTSTFTVSETHSGRSALNGVPRLLAWAISSTGQADTNRTPSGFGLYTFIRTSTSPSSPGTVLSADLCSMSFCLQKYNVSVSSRKLKSSILNTIYADRNRSTHSNSTVSYVFPTGNDDFTLNLGPATEPALELALDALLTGNVSETTASQPQDDNSTSSSTLIAGFDASHNISLAMTNLAAAMTNYIRNASNHTLSGQVGITETYVRVSWPWLILPGLLVVAGEFLLIIGIVATKKRGVDVWKDSELALLFHGLGLEVGDERFAGLCEIGEMDYVASRMKVRMVGTRNGGRAMRLMG